MWFLLHRIKLGYEISVMGANERTARYAGMNTTRILLLTSLIGGGICGLAGMIQASGVEHTLNDQMANGMGYTAIAIAYMDDSGFLHNFAGIQGHGLRQSGREKRRCLRRDGESTGG